MLRNRKTRTVNTVENFRSQSRRISFYSLLENKSNSSGEKKMETQQLPSANDYIDLITYLDVKFRAAEYISTNDKRLFSEEFPVFLRGVKLDFFFPGFSIAFLQRSIRIFFISADCAAGKTSRDRSRVGTHVARQTARRNRDRF